MLPMPNFGNKEILFIEMRIPKSKELNAISEI